MRETDGARAAALLGILAIGCACSAGEGADDSGDPLVGLVVEPSSVDIDTETPIRMRAVAVTESGRFLPVEAPITWSVSTSEGGSDFAGELDYGSVSTAGVFTPGYPTDVFVRASADGLEGSAYLHVIPPGSIDVAFFDAFEAGSPLSGVVSLGSTAGVPIVTNGTITGDFSGPVDVTFTADGFWPLTLMGVRTRSVAVELRRIVPPLSVQEVSGELDFSGAYAPASDRTRLGFAGTWKQGNILGRDLQSLLGAASREETVLGIPVTVPDGVYVAGETGPYLAGEYMFEYAYALGADVATSDLEALLSEEPDLGAAIEALLPEFDSVGVLRYLLDADEDIELDIAARHVTLHVPPLPLTDPTPLVIAVSQIGEETPGRIPVGIGTVAPETSEAEIPIPARRGVLEGRKLSFFVVCEEDSRRAAVRSHESADLASVSLPEFLEPVPVASFVSDAASRTFTFQRVPGADFHLHAFRRLDGGEVREWDVVTPPDWDGFVLPPAVSGSHAALAGGTWTSYAVGLASETYESVRFQNGFVSAEWNRIPPDANRLVVTTVPIE